MDEIRKIHIKNGALIRARNYLLHQTPSDMVAITQITENIVDLNSRHLQSIDAPNIPQVTKKEQQELRRVIEALEENIKKNASAGHILSDAKVIYDLKPWPTRSSRGGISDIVPWPNDTPTPSSRGGVSDRKAGPDD